MRVGAGRARVHDARRQSDSPQQLPVSGLARGRPCRWRRGAALHDLRHTGNTLAAATGASTRELMARMGHASPRAALIYQHARSERDCAIAAALGEMLTAA